MRSIRLKFGSFTIVLAQIQSCFVKLKKLIFECSKTSFKHSSIDKILIIGCFDLYSLDL